MIKVVGIRFKKTGKIYYFDPADLEIKTGDFAIVETARGVEFGEVVVGPKEVADDEVISPLKPVMRVATEDDKKKNEENKEKEKKAFETC